MLTSIFSAALLGISIFVLNGMITPGWLSSRMMLDGGYFVTLAGFVVALIGNGLIALART